MEEGGGGWRVVEGGGCGGGSRRVEEDGGGWRRLEEAGGGWRVERATLMPHGGRPPTLVKAKARSSARRTSPASA